MYYFFILNTFKSILLFGSLFKLCMLHKACEFGINVKRKLYLEFYLFYICMFMCVPSRYMYFDVYITALFVTMLLYFIHIYLQVAISLFSKSARTSNKISNALRSECNGTNV